MEKSVDQPVLSVTTDKSTDIAPPEAKVVSDHPVETSNGASNDSRGVKRPAEDYPDDSDEDVENQTPRETDGLEGDAATMTKSQLKKLKRRKKWEEAREDRKLKRRDKRHERQARKREAREEEIAAAAAEGRDPLLPNNTDRRNKKPGAKVPLAIIVDCQFEKYMLEPELVSLTSQVTRCYSDNRGAQHPVHLYVSSYGGFMKDRYETVLENQNAKWRGIRFSDKDFVETAQEAKEWMAGPKGGKIIDVLQKQDGKDSIELIPPTFTNPRKAKFAPVPEPEPEDVDKSIVYLTADSPYTLERLEPNTCYIVGGIIDKNREKGLCYKIAREKKIRTAKLPIGEYMVLQHRHILATNHVVEIMLKWLETGDWASAFMQVIPSRKGGQLKTGQDSPAEAEAEEAAPHEEETSAGGETVDATQTGITNNPVENAPDGVVEIEGANAMEGLEHNALAEQKWSTPPLEVEVAKEETNEPSTSTINPI